MFNQRKSFFKGKLFYIILLALFAFGIWLNQAPTELNGSEDDIRAGSDYPASTGDAIGQGGGDNYNILDNIISSGNKSTPGGTEVTGKENIPGESENRAYYLVKEVDGMIKIFYYDEEGKESLIRETDIAFSLLSVADQAFFQRGVIKHTTEELNELLQDFES